MSPIDVFFPGANQDIDDADTVVQPDVVVVCDPEKLISEGINGAPDLIVEVISPASFPDGVASRLSPHLVVRVSKNDL